MKLGYGLPNMPDFSKPFLFKNYTDPIKIPAPLYTQDGKIVDASNLSFVYHFTDNKGD